MKRKIIPGLLLIIALAFLGSNMRIGYAETTAAPRATGYEISWHTISGSAVQNLGGGMYTLSGIIGQFDAGTLSGGTYNLNGGFWVESFGYQPYLYYLPVIRK